MSPSQYDSLRLDSPLVISYSVLSSISLILCWLLAPILLYITLTQSKSMGKFKWLILHHSFWCLCTETALGLVKPIVLAPAPTALQVGYFRFYGDFRTTIAILVTTLLCSMNGFAALLVTLASRYMTIFPGRLQEISKKRWFSFAVALFYAPAPVCTVLILVPCFQMTRRQIDADALGYDTGLAPFLSQQTFFMVPHSPTFDMGLNVILGITFVIQASIITSFFLFLRDTFKHRKNGLNHDRFSSVLNSCMAQVGISAVFLMIPMTAYGVFVRFDVPGSGVPLLLLWHLLCLHCLLDFCATLYFVAPYRRFLTKCLRLGKAKRPQGVSVTTRPSLLVR